MKKSRKILSVLSISVLVGSMFFPTIVSAKAKGYNANPEVQEVDSDFRSKTVEEVLREGKVDFDEYDVSKEELSESGQAKASSAVTPDDVGVTKPWVTVNNVTGQYVLTEFTLKGVGEHGEVWVANNLEYPEGDPRNADGVSAVTDEQVNYLLNEFDENIYEQEVEFFDAPTERKGEQATFPEYHQDESGRVVILIDNIKDDSYYEPNYPSYIAGYFSSTISDFTDRNVMTIDSFDWANRTGPDAERPFMYEGTFAHEFQHLLHRDSDSAEENFINEGLSDFAQYLVGYGHSTSHVDFLMSNLKNSLTQWGDQSDLQILGDYGIAYLFQLYLYEQYGPEFLDKEFEHQLQGIDSINAVLEEMGSDRDFHAVYQDFMIALMLDGNYQGDSKTFNFNSIDLDPDLDVAAELEAVAPAWGTDVKFITPDKKVDHLYFKGIDFLGTNWTTTSDPDKGEVLWGNQGDQADNFLIKELDLTGETNPTLSFETKYEIEEQWDFGVVQVSTDDGETWTSLENENTSSDIVEDGYPTIKENVPGLTGSSNGWTTESFDLSPYAGQKVHLAFRYMTDWGYNDAGWYLSNLKINDELIDAMETTDGFMSLEQVTKEYVDYQVQFIGFKKGKAKGKDNHVKVIKFPDLLNMRKSDRVELGDMLQSSQYSKVLMMVTYAPEAGKGGSAEYDYEVVMKDKKNK
ncbi:Immune inhibitor A peptidase M6 [Gracilibacillus orientalis]|uniref:Immune inhibitor A peptidase M6 n=1 Tax=Gracilibacillus orientalis TaxID=334253 RepID=A0A1I4K1C1_9BACI|nr:choice-of-anchor J domain-containing protein [Gracilibacillus orientalis]SFL72558.1 Immune inhibitor A peptidase M6 [Gracilibacillus orientalis]